MKLLRRITRSALHTIPDEGRLIKSTMRNLILKKNLVAGRFMNKFKKVDPSNKLNIYWIDPTRIEYHSYVENASTDWEDWIFRDGRELIPVQDGEWDRKIQLVSNMRVCRAVKARIQNGSEWKSSEFYKVSLSHIENGRFLWGCHNKKSFDDRCLYLDRLIESIQKYGYLSKEDLFKLKNIESTNNHREVEINISREGYPLFQDGRHRLAIALALGLDKIPVQISVRHKEWQLFHEFIQNMARGSGGASKKGTLYQDPIHFELSDIPYSHGCEDRWCKISEYLSSATGYALDIGCNLGYFCHKLERLGFSSIGVEYYPDIAYAAEKIAMAEKCEAQILVGDVLSDDLQARIVDKAYSVILALNIFHHFIKTKEGYSRTKALVGKLRAEVLFFEPHLPEESQMVGAFCNPTPEEFVSLIKEWGSYGRAIPIYTAADGRTVYMLDRQV